MIPYNANQVSKLRLIKICPPTLSAVRLTTVLQINDDTLKFKKRYNGGKMLFYYFCIAMVSLKVPNGLLKVLYSKAKQISNLITNAMMIHEASLR